MGQYRRSGILIHPTSLPGPEGIGVFGAEALKFVDFLADAGQSLWQVLPLGPTAYGNSPYSCYSAFAGNPLLVDLSQLVAEGDLSISDLPGKVTEEWVDFSQVGLYKRAALHKAATHFFADNDISRKEEFWHFCDTTFWLHDYALFMALKEHFGGISWREWPEEIARRQPSALEDYSQRLGLEIGSQKYMQWQFARQWHRVREYANAKGVVIIGDAPIFVAFDSADVWCNRHLFQLDDRGRPRVVAGVPPDYFSRTGQLWGNPLYDWDRHAADRFSWWIARLRNDFTLYDMVRIDHFRGFEAYWEVPWGEKTAVKGRWVKGPGDSLFYALRDALGSLPLIAEDLGVITPEVEALRDRFGFPGMKILQFAFDSGPHNPYLPHNHVRECVVYTGTHDNDTTTGWYASLRDKEKKRVQRYLDRTDDDMVWRLIRTAIASVARLAVIPAQDLLSLGTEARMNLPGTAKGNWSWRLNRDALTPEIAGRLYELTKIYGRLRTDEKVVDK
jgi:4-alpha-glucanotransferase